MSVKNSINRVIYMAHPLSGDIPGNLARARRWQRWLEENFNDVAVIASWIIECEIWDDDNPEHRAAGLQRDLAVIFRCDELWLVGGALSTGMNLELMFAIDHGMVIRSFLHLGAEPPASGLGRWLQPGEPGYEGPKTNGGHVCPGNGCTDGHGSDAPVR